MIQAHSYVVNTHWLHNKTGTVTPSETPAAVYFDVPPEFGGEGGHWTPEHMLVAAVASCYVATFSALAAMSSLQFIGLEVAVEGVLSKELDGLRFTRIIVRPSLTLGEDANERLAHRLLEKAERGCLIARSLSAGIALEPEITIASPEPALV